MNGVPAEPYGPGAATEPGPERGPARLVLAVTHPMTARYLLGGQAAFLRARGFDVWVVTSPGPDLERFREREAVPVEPLPMSRSIRPLADLVSLKRFYSALRRLRPSLINASTPKAGLLGMLAAWMARVPVRVYTLRGLRAETARGPLSWLLRWAEKTSARLAHRVVCVGPSLKSRALELGIADPTRTVILANGSSNGVDLERFRHRGAAEAAGLRRRLALPDDAPVVGFVGRLTRDKGVADLAAVFFDGLVDRVSDCRLLLLGDFEEEDPLSGPARRRLEQDPRVAMAGFVSDTAPYYALMDVLAFPSYREGFPNAPLEAAASEVPTVGYAAVGTVDAVADGVTGTLVPTGDVEALREALWAYLENHELRRRHGAAARARAARLFDQRLVWAAWADEYRRLLAASESR